MTDKLQNLDNRDLVIHAIETNVAEFLLAMGQVGGGEEHRSDSITWTIGGSPIDYHNAVVHARLSNETADAEIQQVIACMKKYQVPGTWHLSPSMTPANLGKKLEAHGFINGGGEPGMAVYLPDLKTDFSLPEGFIIKPVQNDDELAIWEKTLAQGFGEGEREAKWVVQVYRQLGYGDESNWRHYIGFLNQEAVATTSMFLGAGVAGIYFVFTVAQARRKGIGAAITAKALLDANNLGYKVGVLGASEMGAPVYEKLGFRAYCNFTIYEWQTE